MNQAPPGQPRDAGHADVVITGGGIGGLSMAVALSRAGLRVRVLEEAATFGEVGAGLQIAPNGTRVLRSWGLLDEVTALGVLPRNLIMRDALDGSLLTALELADAEQRYGAPYIVMHRSDLHGALLRACQSAGVDLVTHCQVTDVVRSDGGAAAISATRKDRADVVIAADGLHSALRRKLSDDQPVSSAYVAYRGAVPMEQVSGLAISSDDVVLYIGPRCHFVQYPLRRGEIFNQVAVFESAKARAGEAEWGTPDELDAAFVKTCEPVRRGLGYLWRDRWWPMFDRDPIGTWVLGRLVLCGDAAHPPLQYLAQGAVMAIEDAWVLAEHVRAHTSGGVVDWDAALAGYVAVRSRHTARVITTARAWGRLWHLDGPEREERNQMLRSRDPRDYTYVDWLYGPTAVVPAELAPPFPAPSS
jgi:3-hydroxybenzoate 6-monooxygenase